MTSRLPGLLADIASGDGRITITDATLFDGSGGAPTATSTIEISGSQIAEVNIGEAVPGADTTVIDAAGRFTMPGLIDAHAHLAMREHSLNQPRPPKGAEPLRPAVDGHLIAATLRKALRMGVTTVRDVGAVGDVIFEVRQAMRYGAFVGPRLLVSGRIVSPTSPGGRFFEGMYREADGVDDIRRAVREQIRRGADFLKIMSTGARSVELENPHPAQCTDDEMAAFVDEARRQGYRTAAHCEGLGGTELAVNHGVDTIEHGFYLNQRPDLLDRMADRGTVLVPTLSFLHDVAEDGRWAEVLVDQGRYNVEQAHLTLSEARARGVRLAMGFDSPDVDRSAEELVRMVEHGLPAGEALAAATSGGAAALGIDEITGSIAPGRAADLVIVDGDPLADPAILLRPEHIWMVVRNGRPVAGTALEAHV